MNALDRLAPLVAGLVVTGLVVAVVAHVVISTLAGISLPPP